MQAPTCILENERSNPGAAGGERLEVGGGERETLLEPEVLEVVTRGREAVDQVADVGFLFPNPGPVSDVETGEGSAPGKQ